MSTSSRDLDCGAVQEALTELALGTLSGLERATVLAHVGGCSSCREEVDRLSAVADAVLILAPEVEPPAGFETRLFESMGVARPRRWHWARRGPRVALAGCALLGALGLGLGFALTSGANAPSVATSAIAANLTADHGTRGEVYIAPGQPGWLFMSVDDAKVTGLVTCRLRTLHDGTVTVGTFWLESGSGTWVYELPVPANQVQTASIVSGDGTVLASADLSR